MSFMGKLKFWKHDTPALETPIDGIDTPEFSANSPNGQGDNNLGLNNDNLGLDNNDPGLPQGHDGMPEFGSETNSSQTPGQGSIKHNVYGAGIVDPKSEIGPPVVEHGASHNHAQVHKDFAIEKNIEVISSKLDALKAMIEGMNQRLSNIERIAGQEQHQKHNKRPDW